MSNLTVLPPYRQDLPVWFALFDRPGLKAILALVEVLFAQAASLRLFRERPSAREWLGMTLIVAAAAVLIGG